MSDKDFTAAYNSLLTTKHRGAKGTYAEKGQDTTGDGIADARKERRLERDEAKQLWDMAYEQGWGAGRDAAEDENSQLRGDLAVANVDMERVGSAACRIADFFYAFDERLDTDAPDDTLLLGYGGDTSDTLTYGDLRRLRAALEHE